MPKSSKEASTSAREAHPNAAAKAKTRPYNKTKTPASSSTEPGVSKIKAAIRQTTRLLTKDNLAQDVRQEAQRRLASLQSDLSRRQSSDKERKNAERYHKVRFFERQKLVRQIKQIKKQLDESPEDSAFQTELSEKRILLHYVLTFPTSLKYVALFPSSGESPFTRPADAEQDTDQSRKAKATYEQAMSMREKVRSAVARGELSAEPEVDLERGAKPTLALDDSSKETKPSVHKKSKKSSAKVGRSNGERSAQNVREDDFFASDDDDEDA